MGKNKFDDIEKVTIDVSKIRDGAGGKPDKTKDVNSGIISLNENTDYGISREYFTKEKKDTGAKIDK